MHTARLGADEPPMEWMGNVGDAWADVVRRLFKEQGLPDELIEREIVSLQGDAFAQSIEDSFQGVEWNSPDYEICETLKRNTWNFSAAKNYNDLIRLNSLLLDDKDNIRSWSAFKREARKVVGDSMRYLETEHRTVTIAAQKAAKWAEIQRDKYLFPFVQFDVVMDKHTSDICRPLHDVVMSVGNPLLEAYYPPNHFNCRTSVRRLRRGKETKNIILPEIPEAFKNNAGISGLVFTDVNKYIENAPKQALNEGNKAYVKTLIKQAKLNLIGKKVMRNDLYEGGDSPIIFSSRGIKDAINNPVEGKDLYYLKNAIVLEMDEILKDAEYLGFSKYKSEKSIKGSHIFKVALKNTPFYMIVRHYKEGGQDIKRFYSVTTKDAVLKDLIRTKKP